MHQMDIASSSLPFSEIDIPDNIWNLHLAINEEINKLPDICYIFDRNIFSTFVNDVNHFIQLGLLNADDCRLIKHELLLLLNYFENLAREGGPTPRNKISIYISNIYFESSYSYYQSDKGSLASLSVFALNTVNTQDPIVCKIQKKWVETLRRYSVLISSCGEMDRVKFVTKQKEIINLL